MKLARGSNRAELLRQLGWPDGVAIFVGIIVGSGIFQAPAAVAAAAPWLGGGLLLWVLGGLIAACGALCYAECGARLPRSGGFFVIYREVYGEPLAFVAGWTALLVTYPASLAAIALMCSAYLGELVTPLAAYTAPVAAAVIVCSGVLNAVGVRVGALGLRLLSAAKALTILLLCAAALALNDSDTTAAWLPEPGWSLNGAALAVAAAMILFTYDGWSDVTLVSGELREPAKDLGRTALIGISIVVLLYLMVQLAVGTLLSPEAAANSEHVFSDAVRAGLGPGAGTLIAGLVVLSTSSAVHAIVMTQSRIGFAMARDGVFPAWFGAVHPVYLSPARSLACVTVIGACYVFAGDFAELVTVFTFAVWIFYGLTAIALLILRRRGVGEPLEWRAPGGLIPPLVVLLAGLGMTWSIVNYDPKRALHGLIGLAAGFVFYFVWRRSRPKADAPGTR